MFLNADELLADDSLAALLSALMPVTSLEPARSGATAIRLLTCGDRAIGKRFVVRGSY